MQTKIVHAFLTSPPSPARLPRLDYWLDELHHTLILSHIRPIYVESVAEALTHAQSQDCDILALHNREHFVLNFDAFEKSIADALGNSTHFAHQPVRANGYPYDGVQLFRLKGDVGHDTQQFRRFPINLDDYCAHIDLEEDPEEALHFLERIARIELPALYNLKAHSWKNLLVYLRNIYQNTQKVIYLTNTEELDEGVVSTEFGPIQNFYALASGLKIYYLMHRIGFRDDATLTIYDFSQAGLELQRNLIQHWDGHDLPKFLVSVAQGERPECSCLRDLLKSLPEIDDLQAGRPNPILSDWTDVIQKTGGASSFQELWQRIRGLKVEYLSLDLIHDFRALKIETRPGPSFIWFSHVFDYTDTLIAEGGSAQMRHCLREFVNYVKKSNPDTYLLGQTPRERPRLDHVSGWADHLDAHPLKSSRPQMKRLSSVYRKPYHFTADMFSDRIPDWQNWFSEYRLKPDLNFLEIGTYEGASALWLMENILTDSTARLTVVDCFTDRNEEGDPVEEIFLRNLEMSGFEDRITVIKGQSDEELFGLKPKSFDFIYIDASLRGRDALTDGVLAWSLLKDDGWMIFGDHNRLNLCPAELATSHAVDTFISIFRTEIRDWRKTELQIALRKREIDFKTTKTYLSVFIGGRAYDWRDKEFIEPDFYRKLNTKEISLIEGAVRAVPLGVPFVNTDKLKNDLREIARTSSEDIERMGI